MKVSRNFFKSNLSFLYFNYNNNRFDNSKFKIDISENTNFNRIFKTEEISSELHLIQKDIINANEYLIHHQEDTENLGVAGGYIDFISLNKIIGVNGIGELFLFDTTNYEFKKINSNLVNIYKSQNYKGKIIPQLRGKFSVRDIYFDDVKSTLYISIPVEVKENSNCYGMAIYSSNVSFSENISDIKFKKFFTTSKCNVGFNGHATGGKIKKLKDQIIFTVGDLDHNIYGNKKIPQSKTNAIGKIISINEKGEFKVISMGHRNPQGLTVFKDKIFITEHGPWGGDELNRIIQDKHYGWPYYSYGFTYSRLDIFKRPHQKPYQQPHFVFPQETGISEVVFYGKSKFERWENHFIIGTLKSKSIYILNYDLENDRIIYAEKIPIGFRIRDIAVSENGDIFLSTDERRIIKLSLSDKIKYEKSTLKDFR